MRSAAAEQCCVKEVETQSEAIEHPILLLIRHAQVNSIMLLRTWLRPWKGPPGYVE